MSELIDAIKMISANTIEHDKPVDVLFGSVVSVSPLSIRLNESIVLDASQLILTNAVRDYKSYISFDDPSVHQLSSNWNVGETEESTDYRISFKSKQKHVVTIYNALEIGESVILLRMKGGQRFVVLDRVEVRE